MRDPEELEQRRRKPLAGDDKQAAITVVQAQKCAQIIGAYVDGHVMLEDAVTTVRKFLEAAAIVGAAGPAAMPPRTLERLWAEIDALPWLPSGPPKPQPDVD